jgi:N-acetylneuraminic acid mutarotase
LFLAKTGHTATIVKKKIYVFGGIDLMGKRTNDMFAYDLKK